MRIRIACESKHVADAVAKAFAGTSPMNDRARNACWRNGQGYAEFFNQGIQKLLSEYQDPNNPRPRGSTEWWLKYHIKVFYQVEVNEGRRAAGNLDTLSAWEEKELAKLRRTEFKFLRGFLDDIDNGRGTMDYGKRMRMYADAASGPFWLGFVMGDRSKDRRIKWVWNPLADHCQTCRALNGRVWTVEGFIAWYRKWHTMPGKCTKCLCLTTPDSRITTACGLVPISEIRVGDMVLTHKNRWKPVTKVYDNKSVAGHRQAYMPGLGGELIGCTSDHRWWTPDGWRDLVYIDNNQLPVFTTTHEQTMHELRSQDASRQKTRNMQRMREHSSEGMYFLRNESENVQRFGSSIIYDNEARRAEVCALLDTGRQEVLYLPVSMGLDNGEWTDTCEACCASSERGYDGRQIRESEIDDLIRTHAHAYHGQIPQQVNVSIGKLLPIGTPLYDIEVQDDHSFVVEGMICHNSNCKCHLEDFHSQAAAPSMDEMLSMTDQGAREYGSHVVPSTRKHPHA